MGTSPDGATGLIVRNEPEVLAATLSESGTEPNGAIGLYSVLTTLALFFCGPSSPSVASSAADVLPVSEAFLGGRPLGLPVGALFRDAREAGREEGRTCLSIPTSGTWGTAGDGA